MREDRNDIFSQQLLCNFCFLFLPFICWCQCPGAISLKDHIYTIENAGNIDNKQKINQLLFLQKTIQDCSLEKDSINMYLLQKIGKLYFKQADFLNAISFTKASVIVAKQNFPINATSYLAVRDGYYNLQYYYNAINDLALKYNAIDSCIAYSLKGITVSETTIFVLLDKTKYLFTRGEYGSCINNARLGLSILDKFYTGKHKEGYTIGFIAPMIDAMILSEDISAAELILAEQIKKFISKNNSKHLGSIYSFLGNINKYKKNYQAAFTYYKKANQAFALTDFKIGQVETLTAMGILYANNLNASEKGLQFCKKALSYADGPDSLFILIEMGNIYALKGIYAKAEKCFIEAFNTVQPNLNENNIVENSFEFPGFNILQKLLDLITVKGDALVKQFYQTKNEDYLNSAIAVYKRGAIFLAKIIADQQLKSASTLIWRKVAHTLYEHAIDACFLKNDVENGLNFFEKSRATLLNNQIKEQQGMANKDITQLAQLKRDILLQETRLNGLTSISKEYVTIQKELYILRQNLDISLNNIKNKNPLFYTNYIDTSFTTIQFVRENILQQSKSLVEIFSGDSAVYVLTITPNNKTLIKINKNLYDGVANKYINFLEDPILLNKDFTGFVKIANELYQLLFKNNILLTDGIIISPDGKNFPFEALVMNNNAQQPAYFLYNYATSYTYSIKYLTNSLIKSEEATNILGFAPVNYKSEYSLTSLTGSDNSLQKIKNYFSATTSYTYDQATRQNFLQNFTRYKIIQLYTHSSENSLKNEPVIYFSDSALYLSELIVERKPVTQLIILSACQTANGVLHKGEGIFSFNRGFAALGIPAAVSNLWAVDNECNYTITELFYKYLKEGNPTDIALQKAKQYFIKNNLSKEKTLPYFWASSILVGKAGIITENNIYREKIKITALLILLVSGATYIYTRKKHFGAKYK